MSDIELRVAADVSAARQGLEQVSSTLSKMGGQMESTRSRMTSFTLSFNQLGQAAHLVSGYMSRLYGAAADLVGVYGVQEKAEKKLEAALKATQSACGMAADEMKELASSLQAVTTYGDETILGIESLYVSTKAIGREVMPEAVEAALDLADALGTDATSAAKTLAKALADPASGLDTLRRMNIVLTDAQKNEITALQEQGDLLASQKTLLSAIAESYGGIARSLAETDTGKLQQITNVLGDIKESLGKGLLDSISPALDRLYENLQKIYSLVNRQVSWASYLDDAFDTTGSVFNTKYVRSEDFQSVVARVAAAYTDEQLDEILSSITDSLTMANSDALVAAVKEYRASLKGADTLDWGVPEESAVYSAYSSAPSASSGSASSWLDTYGSKSRSYRMDSLAEQISQLAALQAQMGSSSEEAVYLREVMAALTDEYNGLAGAEDAAAESMGAVEEAQEDLSGLLKSGAADLAGSMSGLVSSLLDYWQTYADAAEEALDEVRGYWEDYLDELEESQGRQRDSLNALLSDNLISYEDYINAIAQLDEAEAEAKAEAAAEEEEAAEEADKVNEELFEAEKKNSIAQTLIDGALAISDIWSQYAAVPALAAVLTAASAATTTAQVATISAQEYTPLAAGGIVTAPTNALIGEGGSAEAIIPLSEDNLERYGMASSSGGVINLTVQVKNSYTSSDLAEQVFKAVERAQRTGALPKWRYTA